MSVFKNRSAPVYDDQVNSTLATRAVLAGIVGGESDGPQVPWLSSGKKLVDWLGQSHSSEPMVAVIDLHDKRLQDLKEFGKATIGTNRGEIAGWQLAAHVIVPMMLSGEIPYKIPLIFVSGQPHSLDLARDALAHFPLAQECANLGIDLSVLAKPHRQDDPDARALRRHVIGLARGTVTENGRFGNPLFELGIPETHFDHLGCLTGLQTFWGLSDADMVRLIQLENPADYPAFKSGDKESVTSHWRRHVELLWALKSRLSGLKQTETSIRRREYEQVWLRTPRESLAGRSPLEILLSGDIQKLDNLIAYVEGVDVSPYVWATVPRLGDRAQHFN